MINYFIAFIAVIFLIAVFFLLFNIINFIYKLMKENNVFQRAINETNRRLQNNLLISQNRITAEQELRLNEGEQEKTNLLYRFDLLLEESGIKRYIKVMNTELYFFINTILMVIGIIIGMVLCHRLIISFIVAICVTISMFLCLEIFSIINNRKIERNIIAFINLLGNYNYVSDDIITIFDNLYVELEEPLRGHIKSCVSEARTTGNISLALNHLRFRVNHELFQDIVRNIETCSRYKANYTVITEHAREILIDYLEIKEINKRMAHNFKIEMSIVVVVAFFMFFIVQKMVGANIISFLLTNLVGNFLLLILVLFSILIIYQVIQMEIKAK